MSILKTIGLFADIRKDLKVFFSFIGKKVKGVFRRGAIKKANNDKDTTKLENIINNL